MRCDLGKHRSRTAAGHRCFWLGIMGTYPDLRTPVSRAGMQLGDVGMKYSSLPASRSTPLDHAVVMPGPPPPPRQRRDRTLRRSRLDRAEDWSAVLEQHAGQFDRIISHLHRVVDPTTRFAALLVRVAAPLLGVATGLACVVTGQVGAHAAMAGVVLLSHWARRYRTTSGGPTTAGPQLTGRVVVSGEPTEIDPSDLPGTNLLGRRSDLLQEPGPTRRHHHRRRQQDLPIIQLGGQVLAMCHRPDPGQRGTPTAVQLDQRPRRLLAAVHRPILRHPLNICPKLSCAQMSFRSTGTSCYGSRMQEIMITAAAQKELSAVATGRRADPIRAKKLRKAINTLANNPNHPGLHSHRYTSLDNAFDAPIWQSYVENHSPAAWRVWWFYGPGPEQITIVAIGPHP